MLILGDFAPLWCLLRSCCVYLTTPLGGFFLDENVCLIDDFAHTCCAAPAAPLGDFCSDENVQL